METLIKGFHAWQGMTRLNAVAKKLEKRGFDVSVCETREAAMAVIREVAASAQSVSFGGSMTSGTLGIPQAMRDAGKTVIEHGVPGCTLEEKLAAMRSELTADLFISSINALTEEGVIVNKDGVGNRVAAMIFGPKQTLLVVGRNKLVRGGVDAALARIEEIAGPLNVYRLDRKTPCAVTGRCEHCAGACPDSICRVTTIIEQRPSLSPTHVVLINEDLGL